MADKSVFGTPGSVTVKGREFCIPQPTPSDLIRVRDRMRDIALKECMSPLQHVNAQAEQLLPGVLAMSLREAIALGSGGGVEPHAAAVARAYESLEGIRFRLWYFARKVNKELPIADIEALVGEDERYEVSDAMFEAQPMPERALPKAGTSGAS